MQLLSNCHKLDFISFVSQYNLWIKYNVNVLPGSNSKEMTLCWSRQCNVIAVKPESGIIVRYIEDKGIKSGANLVCKNGFSLYISSR